MTKLCDSFAKIWKTRYRLSLDNTRKNPKLINKVRKVIFKKK